MKEFIVSLYAVTKLMSLAELSERLGLTGSSNSHDLGSPHPGSARLGKLPREHTIWKMEASLAADQPLDQHLTDLIGKFSLVNFQHAALPPDLEFSLDIAVMTDQPMCTVVIPPNITRVVGEKGIGFEVTYYPSNDETLDP